MNAPSSVEAHAVKGSVLVSDWFMTFFSALTGEASGHKIPVPLILKGSHLEQMEKENQRGLADWSSHEKQSLNGVSDFVSDFVSQSLPQQWVSDWQKMTANDSFTAWLQ